jgi:hypothetical protein
MVPSLPISISPLNLEPDAPESEILLRKALGPLTGFKSGVIREETGR